MDGFALEAGPPLEVVSPDDMEYGIKMILNALQMVDRYHGHNKDAGMPGFIENFVVGGLTFVCIRPTYRLDTICNDHLSDAMEDALRSFLPMKRNASDRDPSDATDPIADAKPAEFEPLEDQPDDPARHPLSSDPDPGRKRNFRMLDWYRACGIRPSVRPSRWPVAPRRLRNALLRAAGSLPPRAISGESRD